MQNVSSAQEQQLIAAYAAFNSRSVNAAIALMTPDVTWPRAFKGGFIQGHEEIRTYWTEQWSEIDPRVEPVSFKQIDPDQIVVTVHQVVRDLNGNVLAEENVGHRFTFKDGLIKGMDLCDAPAE